MKNFVGYNAGLLSVRASGSLQNDALAMITYKSDIGGSLQSFCLVAHKNNWSLWKAPSNNSEMAIVVDGVIKTINVGW